MHSVVCQPIKTGAVTWNMFRGRRHTYTPAAPISHSLYTNQKEDAPIHIQRKPSI